MASSPAKHHFRVTPAGLDSRTHSTTLWAENEEDAAYIGRLLLGIPKTREVAVVKEGSNGE